MGAELGLSHWENKRRLKGCDSKELRKMSEPERVQVTGQWRKLNRYDMSTMIFTV